MSCPHGFVFFDSCHTEFIPLKCTLFQPFLIDVHNRSVSHWVRHEACVLVICWVLRAVFALCFFLFWELNQLFRHSVIVCFKMDENSGTTWCLEPFWVFCFKVWLYLHIKLHRWLHSTCKRNNVFPSFAQTFDEPVKNIMWQFIFIVASAASYFVIEKLHTSCWSTIHTLSGWWFQTFFIFHNIWDNPSHWLSYFSRWLKSPTNYCIILWSYWLYLVMFLSGWTVSGTRRRHSYSKTVACSPEPCPKFLVVIQLYGLTLSDLLGIIVHHNRIWNHHKPTSSFGEWFFWVLKMHCAFLLS